MKKRYADVRRALHVRWLGKPSIRPHEWDAEKRDIPRHVVYNHLPAVPVDPSAKLTTETRRQADGLFERLALGCHKPQDKQAFFQRLFHTAKRAMHAAGTSPPSDGNVEAS